MSSLRRMIIFSFLGRMLRVLLSVPLLVAPRMLRSRVVAYCAYLSGFPQNYRVLFGAATEGLCRARVCVERPRMSMSRFLHVEAQPAFAYFAYQIVAHLVFGLGCPTTVMASWWA